MSELQSEYEHRYREYLVPIARKVQSILEQCLSSGKNIDRISARAKSPDRFIAKAAKVTKEGTPKYTDPLTQIQDQIGARIIVYYLVDVEVISNIIMSYFHPVEHQSLIPESDWEFGYFGKHFVLALPPDVFADGVDTTTLPQYFELLVKTLFQHAWSEANHDLGYKSPKPLTPSHNRQLAYTAAQAWGADRVFADLYGELTTAPPAPSPPASGHPSSGR